MIKPGYSPTTKCYFLPFLLIFSVSEEDDTGFTVVLAGKTGRGRDEDTDAGGR